jgi:hypothetical protein
LINSHLFGNQLAQQFDGEVSLLHPGDLFEKFRIEQRKLLLDVGEEVDYTVALDADMVFARNLGQWWDLMEEGGRPIVMSQAMTYRSVPITDRRFRKVFDDNEEK